MTSAEIIVINLVLEKCPERTPINLLSFMSSSLLAGKYQLYSSEIIREITDLINNKPDIIRKYLLKEKYFDTVKPNIPRDILNDKGEKAKELGGHEKYKEWEVEEKRKKRIEDFPKNKWYWYDPLKIIVTLLIGMLIGHFTCQNNNKNAQLDTQKKDTINNSISSPQMPKISDSSNKVQ